jgi:hypothetical protein
MEDASPWRVHHLPPCATVGNAGAFGASAHVFGRIRSRRSDTILPGEPENTGKIRVTSDDRNVLRDRAMRSEVPPCTHTRGVRCRIPWLWRRAGGLAVVLAVAFLLGEGVADDQHDAGSYDWVPPGEEVPMPPTRALCGVLKSFCTESTESACTSCATPPS